MIYYAEEKGNTGNFYVGRTRGKGTVDQVTNKRWNSHHRTDIKQLVAQCVTDTYSACRGAEQKHYDDLMSEGVLITSTRKPGRGAQIAPISDDNPRKDDYIACAKATATLSPKGCPICAK